ncbi:polysaccharide biosynthesis tyrosine autokinase [Azohydromonas aeria]|uniref:polysaccharide biosynthesis tyrosine autokinase n=1 Tax=Azohydromonas aeria TaxID=2590212 RepID=UPI0018DFB059|nr:polysaccharide biosynthesis tyrosine autokinase [Azohydromonas aeria]
MKLPDAELRDWLKPVPQRCPPSIGDILIDAGLLDAAAAARVAEAQHGRGMRFGEAAVQLRLLKAEDVQYALARQYEYPYLRPQDSTASRDLVAAFEPFGACAEAMRTLRTSLMLQRASSRSRPFSIAVLGAMAGEGRSFVAANLAVVFSQMGQRTLLIDADLRAPRQHTLFKLPPQLGLSNLLLGRSGTECIAPLHDFHGLSILVAGALPPNPQELLGRARLGTLLEQAAVAFDVVIVDTPAAGRFADAQIVATHCGMGVLVARRHSSDVGQLRRVHRTMVELGVPLAGTVLNDA